LRKRADTTFTRAEAAESWLARQRASIEAGTWRSPDRAAESFGDYATRWLSTRTDLKQSTAVLYQGLLRRHLLPTLGEMCLKDITPTIIRIWQTHLARTTGPTARAQSYRLVRTILNDAIRDEAIVANPCTIRGGGTTHHRERTPATIDEVAGIANAVLPRYHFLIHLAAWSGLRRGELFDLRRGSFEFQGDRVLVTITSAAVAINNKYVVGTTKSTASRRTIHLPSHLVEPLKKHLAEFVDEDDDALVFTTRHGTRVASSNLSQMLHRAARHVGRDDLRFHDLRHTGATITAQAGATAKELMNRLGHSSPRAALIYQHAAEDRDWAIAEALGEAAAAAKNTGSIPLQRK